MGCCLPTLMTGDEILMTTDGVLQFQVITGGLTLIRGYIQQDIPGGTLFVTDRNLIHCTKGCGYNRMDFELFKIKELQYSDTFGNSCHCHFPCIQSCPDSYIIFRIKIDRKEHQVGIKVKDSEHIFDKIMKVTNKKLKRQLSVISEESQTKVVPESDVQYHVKLENRELRLQTEKNTEKQNKVNIEKDISNSENHKLQNDEKHDGHSNNKCDIDENSKKDIHPTIDELTTKSSDIIENQNDILPNASEIEDEEARVKLKANVDVLVVNNDTIEMNVKNEQV